MAGNLLDILAGTPETPQQRAQSLADALRRKQAFGAIGMMSGDPVSMRFGRQQAAQGDELALERAMNARASQGIAQQKANTNTQTADRLRARDEVMDPLKAKKAEIDIDRGTVALDRFRTEPARAAVAKVEKEAKAAAAKEEKLAGSEAKFAIPGYERTRDEKGRPTVEPTAVGIGQLRAAVADKKSMTDSISELTNIVRKSGLSVMPGPARQRVKVILQDLRLKLKGPAVYQLGVLSGPDMQLLTDITGDPTALSTYFKGGAETAITQLDELQKRIEASASSKLESSGYTPARAKGSTSKGAEASPVVPTDKNKAAMEWAQANPGDPRAAAILAKLGAK